MDRHKSVSSCVDNHQHDLHACETTSLLGEDNKAAVSHGACKPFPRGQMLLLCYARLMESIAFFSVFPYVPEMIQRNATLRAADIGLYAGLIESATSLAEISVLTGWCWLADRIGRRRAIASSLCGLGISLGLFGISGTFTEMIVFRLLTGVFSGAGLIIRTMVKDLAGPEMQATGFSWFSMADALGALVGPLLGGSLVDPASRFPTLFSGLGFFERHPYALGGIVIGIINCTGALTSLLLLRDPTSHSQYDGRNASDTPSLKPENQNETRQVTWWGVVQHPSLFWATCVYGHVALTAMAYVAILPIALHTPISMGGMQWPPLHIALYMGGQAICQFAWLLAVFPRLHRRLGTTGVLRLCSAAYPVLFGCYITMNALLRNHGAAFEILFWVIVATSILLSPVMFVSLVASQLVLGDVSSDPQVFRTLNVIALILLNVTRVVAPEVSTVFYSVGVRNHVCAGYLGWLFAAGVAGSMWFTIGRFQGTQRAE